MYKTNKYTLKGEVPVRIRHEKSSQYYYGIAKGYSEFIYPIYGNEYIDCKLIKEEVSSEIKEIFPDFSNIHTSVPPSKDECKVTDIIIGEIIKEHLHKCSKEVIEMDNPEGFFNLREGLFGHNSFGKYRANLFFISEYPMINWQDISLNLPNGSANLSCVYGDFFTTKKGTKAFRIKTQSQAKHILVKDSWGGCFNDYRGRQLDDLDTLYFRRASSNGGGTGNDYAIIEKGQDYLPSIDDI